MRIGLAGVAAWVGLALAASVAHAGEDPLAAARAVDVQDGGRVKPLDVWARESVRLVTGKARWTGPDGKTREDALRTALRWCADPAAAAQAPLLAVEHPALRERLGLPVTGPHRIAYATLAELDAFRTLLREAAAKDRAKAPMDAAERQAGSLHAAFARLGDILHGQAPRCVPLTDEAGSPWPAPAEVPSDATAGSAVRVAFDALLTALRAGDDPACASASTALAAATAPLAASARAADLAAATRMGTTPHHPAPATLAREVHYFAFAPLDKAWWGYLLGAIAIAATLPIRRPAVAWLAVLPVLAAFGLHVYGIGLRISVTGRPPITNLYESVLWAMLAVMGFALLLEAIHRVRLYALVGAVVAWIGLSFAQPWTGLDPAMSPLVPVLRNNFWLTIHVPTIVSSYGAFALAMGLGHVAMGLAIFAPGRAESLHRVSTYIYRAMQIGVLLLAAGTILGGVWASYSWGRFWGWDPKEVGALVALLGYLAALHGRFAGWWHDFGLAASSVICFQGVILAWYGVNILGSGLHSYGFADGSIWAPLAVCGAELLLVACAVGVRVRQRRTGPPPAAIGDAPPEPGTALGAAPASA